MPLAEIAFDQINKKIIRTEFNTFKIVFIGKKCNLKSKMANSA